MHRYSLVGGVGLAAMSLRSGIAMLGAVFFFWQTVPAHALEICSGGNRAARKVTCIYDGDTGWQHGLKWRLLDIDAPELVGAACEREHALAIRSRDRLTQLMRPGYVIHWNGRRDRNKRALVSIMLRDGSDLGRALIAEGLAQPWPNRGNKWCETSSER